MERLKKKALYVGLRQKLVGYLNLFFGFSTLHILLDVDIIMSDSASRKIYQM